MGLPLLYVDRGGIIGPADWPAAVQTWAGLFPDRDYVKVNGKPLFMLIDVYNMLQAFGGSHAAVRSAFDSLRAAAQQKGLPGVYVVGGFGVFTGAAFDDTRFYDF